MLDDTAAVYSAITGAPLVCLVKNFLGEKEHYMFQQTSETVESGYFGTHNDYRQVPCKSKKPMKEQKLVFSTLETVMLNLKAVACSFCPMDQEFLYSCVRPEYITAGVGTTLEILRLTKFSKNEHAQNLHFDRNNTADSMTFVLCVGQYRSCRIHMPGLSVTVETTPGDLYIFPGGDILHEVEAKMTKNEIRWSWIIFHHNRLLQQHPCVQTVPPQWLIPRNTKKGDFSEIAIRLAQLQEDKVKDPDTMIFPIRTRTHKITLTKGDSGGNVHYC